LQLLRKRKYKVREQLRKEEEEKNELVPLSDAFFFALSFEPTTGGGEATEATEVEEEVAAAGAVPP
jgi:hypothetical protein